MAGMLYLVAGATRVCEDFGWQSYQFICLPLKVIHDELCEVRFRPAAAGGTRTESVGAIKKSVI